MSPSSLSKPRASKKTRRLEQIQKQWNSILRMHPFSPEQRPQITYNNNKPLQNSSPKIHWLMCGWWWKPGGPPLLSARDALPIPSFHCDLLCASKLTIPRSPWPSLWTCTDASSLCRIVDHQFSLGAHEFLIFRESMWKPITVQYFSKPVICLIVCFAWIRLMVGSEWIKVVIHWQKPHEEKFTQHIKCKLPLRCLWYHRFKISPIGIYWLK